MARFEYSRERKRNFSDGYSKRSSGSRRTFEGSSRGRRDSGRDSDSYGGRGKRDFKMTKVICSSCGEECEVPFKPTSSKPVYCDACFAKKDKTSSGRGSSKDFEIINEKLNKIMKALDIK